MRESYFYAPPGTPIDARTYEEMTLPQYLTRSATWVAHTTIISTAHNIEVSTVFLWHNVSILRYPVLWETMTFGGPFDADQRRYFGRFEATCGHKKAVRRTQVALALAGDPALATVTARLRWWHEACR